MKVQLSKQLLDAIIAAYNKENDPIKASDIDTLVLGVPFIKVNDTLIEWSIVNLSMQQYNNKYPLNMKKLANIDDLELELWLRQRNSGSIYWKTGSDKEISIKDIPNVHLVNIINMLHKEEDLFEEELENTNLTTLNA